MLLALPRRLFLASGALLLAGLLVSPSSVRADVFERDWLAPGDGLLTYDDVNNREWLDLSQTLLADFDSVSNNGLPGRYTAVVNQTAPGGQFEGFQVATEADFFALAESAGIVTSTTDSTVNRSPSIVLGRLLRNGAIGTIRTRPSRAFVAEYGQSFDPACACIWSVGNFGSVSGLNFNSVDSIQNSFDQQSISGTTAVYLFRTAVPEPCSALCMIVAAASLLQRYRVQ